MKKITYFSLIAILLLFASILLYACGDDEGGSPTDSAPPSTDSSLHFHEYNTSEWIVTDEGHYNSCICHPEVINMKEHVDNLDWNGVCDVCQYVLVKPDTYTVKFVDGEGKPVSGVSFYFKNLKYNDVESISDENGQATVEFTDVSGVNVVLESVPKGYKMPDKKIYKMNSLELTVKIEKSN